MRAVPTQRRILEAARYVVSFPERISVEERAERVRMRETLAKHGRMIVVSALREIARPTPSWPEVAELAVCSHSAAMSDFERWGAMPWRDRANWLDLVERVADTMADEEQKRSEANAANLRGSD